MTHSPSTSTSATNTAGSALAVFVARAKGGDRDAFCELHARLAPMIHAVLLARVAASEVDDLLQEAFVAGWRGLSGLRDDEHVGAWLATIARRLAARHHARPAPATRDVTETVDDEPTDPRPSAAAKVGAAEILGEVTALPEAYRELLMMRLVNGMTGPEIAAATGRPPDSVRVSLSRGMAQLRDRLSRRGWP